MIPLLLLLGAGVAAAAVLAKPAIVSTRKDKPAFTFDPDGLGKFAGFKRDATSTATLRAMAIRALAGRDGMKGSTNADFDTYKDKITGSAKTGKAIQYIGTGDAAKPGQKADYGGDLKRASYRRALGVALRMGIHVDPTVTGIQQTAAQAQLDAAMIIAVYIFELNRILKKYFTLEQQNANWRSRILNMVKKYKDADLPGARKLYKKTKARVDAIGKAPAADRPAMYAELLVVRLAGRVMHLNVANPDEMTEELIKKVGGILVDAFS